LNIDVMDTKATASRDAHLERQFNEPEKLDEWFHFAT